MLELKRRLRELIVLLITSLIVFFRNFRISEPKNQSGKLIVLLIASLVIFLNGCGLSGGVSRKSFYPEYYAAKKLSDEDVIKLRELAVHPDLFIADSATLLLGSYYFHYGDANYGIRLIDKSFNSQNLDEEMSVFGKLWKMEALLKSGETGAATNLASNIKEMRRTQSFMKVMQIYCNQIDVFLVDESQVDRCIDWAILGEEKYQERAKKIQENSMGPSGSATPTTYTPIATDNLTYEEYLEAIGVGSTLDNRTEVKEEVVVAPAVNISPDAKIYLSGGDIFNDVAVGMIFGMGKYNNNYQIEPVHDYMVDENNKKDIVLNLNNLDLFINGEKSNLEVNWLQLSEIASNLSIVSNKSKAVIITDNQHEAHGKIIANEFKSKGKKAFVVKALKGYQRELQNVLETEQGGSYAIIIMANEKDILDIIPIAKYWQVDSRLQNILVVTGYIPSYDLTKEQRDYFKGIYILTAANLASNDEYSRVSEDYKRVYGSTMNGRNALGYDIITYINKVVNNNKNAKYLTNIESVNNGYAVRKPVLYRVYEWYNFVEVEIE